MSPDPKAQAFQRIVKVRGTELSAADSVEHRRQKIARITLDSMVQFVGLLDAQGTVLEINQVALDAVGITLSDVEGRPFWTTFWWQVSDEINATLRSSIARAAQGEFVRWDTEIYGRAGGKETIIIDASLMPVRDEQGQVVFIAAEGRDITEKKAYEREIARQREELARLDVLKTQFFANISHEFRTPLTLMLGPLEHALAEAPSLPPAIAGDLSISYRNAIRLLKLVNMMLDFSRIEAGRVHACFRPTDLAALTTQLASNFQSLFESAGLRLNVNCRPLPAGKEAYVDHDMWEKIVFNLLSNAFKFTLQGQIDVTLATSGNTAILTVQDTGVGIPPEELPHMFERFHRVEQNHGRTHEGTGIGLALVQELVKLHGGAIQVASEVGQGSTFTVTLPLGKAHLDPGRIGAAPASALTTTAPTAFLEEAMLWLPDATAGPATVSTEKPRILWADDNADMRAYVSRVLQHRFQVDAVPDGEAALAAARANPPDLILSDVMMPRLDGFGLLRAIRAEPLLSEVPVILLSARAGEESRIAAMEAGPDDYLVKPFSAGELIARIDTHIKVTRMRAQGKAALLTSEERLRVLADSSPAILWITDADGHCSYVSASWREYTGQPESVALGAGWIDTVHPEDRPHIERAILDATARHEPFSFDMRLRDRHGAYSWMLSSGRPRYDAEGRFAGLAGSTVSIHERKEAARTSALLSAIVDSSEDAIISKDLNGTITSWNHGAALLFGYSAEEVIGKPIMILIPPDRRDEEPRILDRLRRGERIEHFETVRVRKDGSLVNISITISPIRDVDGRVIGASKIARNITDRVRQEQALREANEALQRANGDLQQFAYSASHDLQEPLRMVAIYSELLRRNFAGQMGPKGDEYIRHTVEGALRMERLLSDLRMYTQVSIMDEAPLEEIDAAEILAKTLLNLDAQIQESGASVRAADLPRVRMHPFQLEQILQNLIANAIRYRTEAPPNIQIDCVPQGAFWLFSVRDNGIGIEPQYRKQIFGIFKRLHGNSEYHGTGMGLAICQRVVERCGGKIWVESEPGSGSTFFFTVPR